MKLRSFRPRITYANVVATLALALAMSMGGAYAADKIGSAQIKDNAVKSRHIDNANVTTPDLKNRAVTRAKLARSAQTQVIEYRLGAHDFAATDVACVDLAGLSRSQIRNSVWTAQLNGKFNSGGPTLDDIVYPVPGGGEYGDSQYRVFVHVGQSFAVGCVHRASGPGETYDAVRIIRTVPVQTLVGQPR